MIEEKNLQKTGYRYKSGVWGWICEVFDTDDWGRESYKYNLKVYRIDVVKVAENAKNNINNTFINLSRYIEKEVAEPIESSFEQFFDDFMVTVDRIRGDLIQGKKQSLLNQEQKTVLAKQLGDIKSDLPAIMLDSKELKLDLTDENGVKDKSSQFTTEGAC
ncbi:hypothetical protein [Aeromonas caviae]